ncbi:MAG: metallophosphoesterase, partial [Gemmatimonadales bacterium]
MTTLVHLSDIHFGRDADLEQVAALEELVPSLKPTVVVISGDLTQRARHGEFQRALVFAQTLERAAPTFVVPGNHDVQWWATPLDLFGIRRKYTKYRIYFGEVLSPSLELPGLRIEAALTSHGVSAGSMTWKFWRDTAVKGHLPEAEVARVAARFREAPPDEARVVVMHHNVLRGEISRRMGLARWRQAQVRLAECGVDVILCGHDHQEAVATLGGRVVVSTASTHTSRTRGHRPSAFNLVEISTETIAVRHNSWNRPARRFD